ncbi:hypothetical protein [Streptomyces sp. SBT349]|uniref:hypothetical protein n=1 Tax=Streptomyces sp. SBT349 TaxID=1580539 RepID=UPI00066AC4B7|nr:hypothetical protein [Streptomyces sp. SBT349]
MPGAEGALATYATSGGWRMTSVSPVHSLPRITDIYVRADAGQWQQDFWQLGGQEEELAYATTFPRPYTAGQEYEATWNTGVFGPDISNGDGLFREGDVLYGWLNPFSDGGGHIGTGRAESGSTTLYLNGEEYATAEDFVDGTSFDLPPEEGEYELVTTVRRGEPVASVSTEISASFTFTSATTPEGEFTPLPTSVVRFTPELAPDSTAPAGESTFVPVTVQGAAGENPGSLTVSVSHDRGGTWSELPVADGGVTVENPAAGGSVSLRAEVTDGQGNASSLTVLDAYRTA